MDALEFLIVALAGWRAAYFITKESGPFRIAARLRQRWPLGGLTRCLYCASVWTAAAAYGIWLTPLSPIVFVLALSAAGLMLANFTGMTYEPPPTETR